MDMKAVSAITYLECRLLLTPINKSLETSALLGPLLNLNIKLQVDTLDWSSSYYNRGQRSTSKNTIRDGGSNALYAAYTVDTVDMV